MWTILGKQDDLAGGVAAGLQPLGLRGLFVLARPAGVPAPAVRTFERVAADVAAHRATHL